ncbi:MAG: tetratricopeptide repeat protein [Chloroflexi bacterium]|nr:tetratricopeptide repeat protein [Chloroflexota bacterium]OJW04108.1 MAG: hypothetical protein BGO39_06350 [Chloroflexi bacterium 54-19]
MQLSLLLLGSVEATWAGRPVTFATNSTRALLAYLAVESDRPQPRELLAALLWPDQSRAAAYTNLRQTLVRLRKAFPNPSDVTTFLSITPQTLELNREGVTTDLAYFEDLQAQCASHALTHDPASLNCPACLERLETAAALYRGEFLQGLFLEGSEPFEEWLHFKRETLYRQALQVFRRLTHSYELAGDFLKMRNYAVRHLTLDPLQEDAHADLMRALALTGDRGGALKQYETCRNLLATELGIEPNAETTALYNQIRNGSFSVAAPVKLLRNNLPASLTPFVGRDAELAALEKMSAARLLTLVGTGGMGKTRLALMLGRTRLSAFPDGVFFVSLAPLANTSTIAPTIATTLGISVLGGDPRQALLHNLRDKQLLLILDNFEHLIDGVDIVVDILEAAPLVNIITTSRERLNVRGEHFYLLQGLNFQTDVGLAEAASMEAVRLFVQSAKRVQPGFRLDESNLADLLKICQLVQGMPLGLELAAAWTETLTVGVIAAEVERSADFLTAEWRDAPHRHRSLRAVFDWSWQLLNESERQAFKQLSVFRGGFTAEAAQVVAGASYRTLNNLQRKSLLQRSEVTGTTGWYTIHEALRQFAAEALVAGNGEASQVATRHSAFYMALAEEAETKYYSRDQVTWLDHIEREYDNIRAALAWLEHQGELGTVLRMGGALRYFWFVRGYHTEGSEQLLRTLARPEVFGPSTARIRALNAAGYLQWVRGEETEARKLLEEALAYSRVLDDQPGAAFALCYLGAVTNAQGDYATATGFLEESLTIWRRLQKGNDIGLALMFLGDSMIELGNHERAKTIFAESAETLKHLGNTSVLPYPLRRLGYEAHRLGDWTQAISFYSESMNLNFEVGDRQGVAASLVGLAVIAGGKGDWSGAGLILGAADAMLQSIQTQLLPFDRKQKEKLLVMVEVQTARTDFEQSWQEGMRLTVEQAIRATDDLITQLHQSKKFPRVK